MKKLLLISFLTFFSISAIAETSLRCKFFKKCEDGKCTNDVNESYVQLVYEESWLFENKLTYNSIDFSDRAEFNDDYIKFGTDSSIRSYYYKKSKILKTEYRYRNAQKSENKYIFGHERFYKSVDEFICTEIN